MARTREECKPDVGPWRDEMSELSLPVVPSHDEEGGRGTREGHWRESTFDNELMTGCVSFAWNPLSLVTIASFADLGDASQTLTSSRTLQREGREGLGPGVADPV